MNGRIEGHWRPAELSDARTGTSKRLVLEVHALPTAGRPTLNLRVEGSIPSRLSPRRCGRRFGASVEAWRQANSTNASR